MQSVGSPAGRSRPSSSALTGDLDSEACQALMARMRTDYELLGLDFPEPVF